MTIRDAFEHAAAGCSRVCAKQTSLKAGDKKR
jgi:hypothetical protein